VPHVLIAAVALCGVAGLGAQALQFEVASVKPMPEARAPQQAGMQPGGRLFASNAPARLLIRVAYGLEEYQLIGGPDWMNSARFEVSASAGREATRDEMLAMLRALLADRFSLRSHRETRELPVFHLTVARADRGFGQGMQPSGEMCAPVTLPTGVPMPPPPPPGIANVTPLGTGIRLQCPSMFAPGWISARRVPMALVADRLSALTGRPVIDRTGVEGLFDLDLFYTPDPGMGPNAAGGPPATGVPDAPALVTAIQEQLGLKLEGARGPVPVLVVDSISLPTEN
jgi:uncharacterized protein (TIGR03435 family)